MCRGWAGGEGSWAGLEPDGVGAPVSSSGWVSRHSGLHWGRGPQVASWGGGSGWATGLEHGAGRGPPPTPQLLPGPGSSPVPFSFPGPWALGLSLGTCSPPHGPPITSTETFQDLGR